MSQPSHVTCQVTLQQRNIAWSWEENLVTYIHLLVSGDTWHWYAKKIQIQGDKTRLCFLFQPKPKHFLNISKATRSFAYCMSFSTKPNLEQFPMQWIGLSLHLYIHGKIEELLAWVLMMREISRRLMDRMHFNDIQGVSINCHKLISLLGGKYQLNIVYFGNFVLLMSTHWSITC